MSISTLPGSPSRLGSSKTVLECRAKHRLLRAPPDHPRPLTRQRKVSSAKDRAPRPNVASVGRGKEPSRGRAFARSQLYVGHHKNMEIPPRTPCVYRHVLTRCCTCTTAVLMCCCTGGWFGGQVARSGTCGWMWQCGYMPALAMIF